MGRVWRICQACGEWNLLGPEMASGALPELSHRFGALGTGTKGLTSRMIAPELELLSVGDRTDLVAGAVVLAERRQKLQGIGTGVAIAVVGALALLGTMVVAGWWTPGWGFVAMQAAILGALLLVRTIVRLRRGIETSRFTLPFAALVVVVGGFLSWGGPDPYTAGEIALRFGILAIMTTTGFGLSHFGPRATLPSGERIRVNPEDISSMHLEWDLDAVALTVITGHGRRLDAIDSRYVLTHITEWLAGVPDSVVDQAHAMVATTENLGDFLGLLETVRNGRQRIRLADLPKVYWVAIDLAVVREEESEMRLEQSSEVRAVADIAESLDARDR